ncbi:protein pop-1-like [Synchiropus picturatus]
METVAAEQSSSSPEWMDFDTDLDMVLSTMRSMFGELPPAPAPQESPHFPGNVLPEVEPSGFTDGLNGTGTVINPFQCGATTVPPYGGVLADHNVGAARAGFMSGANMLPLCCQCPYGMRWLQFPPQFLVPQPGGPVAGAFVSPMCLENSFMPYGFVNHQQGACFPCQKEQVPALEGGSVSSPGSFHNVKQCDQTKPCPEPSPQVLTSKRKRGVEPNGVYIRRPPNAFMVFMRENREIVTRTLKPKHSVETNTILGEMWRKMSTDEREIYYQKATEERRIHAEKYPEWSSQDNYGKKAKRQRKKKSIIV